MELDPGVGLLWLWCVWVASRVVAPSVLELWGLGGYLDWPCVSRVGEVVTHEGAVR